MVKQIKKKPEPQAAEPPSIKDNVKIKASKSTKSKKTKKIPARVASKVTAKKQPKFEYNPMRSSGMTSGGNDPQEGVFDSTDLKDEWDS